MKTPSGPARLYHTSHPNSPWLVSYRDPLRRAASGRALRVSKWFADRAEAVRHQLALNERLLAEGTSGLVLDAAVRSDALTARRRLDAAGHMGVSLATLAERFCAQVSQAGAAQRPIAPVVADFLADKAHGEGGAKLTVSNLRTRLARWLDLAAIAHLSDISRASVECLRLRDVSAQTRKNDLAAVSSFCTWLLDRGLLDHHPLKGLRRPKVVPGRKATWSPDECARVLRCAGARAPAVALLLFAGLRPSECAETRLLYGRHPLVRVEGGKLRGRANRMVPMSSALRAWLRAHGDPAQVSGLTDRERQRITRDAAVRWAPDTPRHTCISYRLQLEQNDALVAREAGTSESVIYRHYHGLRTPAEARAWSRLRP